MLKRNVLAVMLDWLQGRYGELPEGVNLQIKKRRPCCVASQVQFTGDEAGGGGEGEAMVRELQDASQPALDATLR